MGWPELGGLQERIKVYNKYIHMVHYFKEQNKSFCDNVSGNTKLPTPQVRVTFSLELL
jgi:hypothetical protein